MYLRKSAAALVMACGLVLADGTGMAGANSSKERGSTVAVTAQVSGGKSAQATEGRRLATKLTITRFEARQGSLWAVGKLVFSISDRSFSRTFRSRADVRSVAHAAQIPPTPNACTILSLTLQPLDLNLLGLRVRTSRIDILIEAVPGPNNLLGNLLCALTGLLDPPPGATPLTTRETAQVLNAILALQPRVTG
jgi:hypothetical protein